MASLSHGRRAAKESRELREARAGGEARGAREARETKLAENRRGSAEAIEKRRVARVFNDLLGGRSSAALKLDGRTEKRRQRLLKELEEGKGRGSRELKPLDVLQHVQELMDLGEPLSNIRKITKSRKTAPPSEALVDVVARFHKAYAFRPEVYRFVGIGDEVLRDAGVMGDGPKKRAKR